VESTRLHRPDVGHTCRTGREHMGRSLRLVVSCSTCTVCGSGAVAEESERTRRMSVWG
jgi:hypothetical protein